MSRFFLNMHSILVLLQVFTITLGQQNPFVLRHSGGECVDIIKKANFEYVPIGAVSEADCQALCAADAQCDFYATLNHHAYAAGWGYQCHYFRNAYCDPATLRQSHPWWETIIRKSGLPPVTIAPTNEPTNSPTSGPSNEPTVSPTSEPSNEPTVSPTSEPSNEPTASPTSEPSNMPTMNPTLVPTSNPFVLRHSGGACVDIIKKANFEYVDIGGGVSEAGCEALCAADAQCDFYVTLNHHAYAAGWGYNCQYWRNAYCDPATLTQSHSWFETVIRESGLPPVQTVTSGPPMTASCSSQPLDYCLKTTWEGGNSAYAPWDNTIWRLADVLNGEPVFVQDGKETAHNGALGFIPDFNLGQNLAGYCAGQTWGAIVLDKSPEYTFINDGVWNWGVAGSCTGTETADILEVLRGQRDSITTAFRARTNSYHAAHRDVKIEVLRDAIACGGRFYSDALFSKSESEQCRIMEAVLPGAPTNEPTASPTSEPSNMPTMNPTLVPTSAWHDDILGGHWTLVRRVKAGNNWHPSTDQLMGTDVYGSFINDPTADATFSIAFDINQVSEFLFATGDGQKWLVASKDSVVGGFYANELRPIMASSKSGTAHSARWYRRNGVQEDPWISLSDHHPAIGTGDILYGGDSFGQTHASAILPHHNGANVFVRFSNASIGRRILSVGRLLSLEDDLQ